MTSQRRMAREEFFRGLDRLDELDGDDSSEEIPFQSSAPNLRTPAADTRRQRPLLDQKKSAPSLPTASSVAESSRDSKTPSSPTRPAHATAISAGLRRTQSDTAPLRRIEKSRAKGKKKAASKASKPIPADQQLFPGLCFYFIPNTDQPSVRKIRIDLAIANGAGWARTWNEPITHILVEPGLEFKEVAKGLPDRKMPEGTPILSDDWIPDCIRRKKATDISQSRFLIKGMRSPFALEDDSEGTAPNADTHTAKDAPEHRSDLVSAITPSKFNPGQDNQSARTETALPAPKSRAHVPNVGIDNSKSDELDSLIDKMKDTNYMALDDLTRQDPSFKFEDDFVLDPEDVTLEKDRWQCKSKSVLGHNNNGRTIDILEQMSRVYERQGDQWRCHAFRKASGALKQQSTWIRTKAEAQALPNIGESIAEKIQEVAYTGSLRRLDNIRSDPVYRVMELFRGIYGVGPSQAQAWVSAGYETLEQLLQGADLTPNQKIGIDHYEDFQTRIPREEVRQHGLVVKEALEAINPELRFVIGGSYRRGSPDSGDIDIMITKVSAGLDYVRAIVMEDLVPRLKSQGFIVAELASSDDKDSSKWMGASCLPGMTIWRRLDLLFVPWVERGAARLYWTGNDIFNRSLRLLASRKGMRLNQHGLFDNVLRGRGRVKITEGRRIAGESEKEIFDILGVTYRPPSHRNP